MAPVRQCKPLPFRSFAAAGRGVEIRRFPRNPIKEARNLRVAPQACQVGTEPLEIGIGEAGVERPVADGMDRDLVLSALAPGYRVMPFDPVAEWAGAKPAKGRARFGHGPGLAESGPMSAPEPPDTEAA